MFYSLLGLNSVDCTYHVRTYYYYKAIHNLTDIAFILNKFRFYCTYLYIEYSTWNLLKKIFKYNTKPLFNSLFKMHRSILLKTALIWSLFCPYIRSYNFSFISNRFCAKSFFYIPYWQSINALKRLLTISFLKFNSFLFEFTFTYIHVNCLP